MCPPKISEIPPPYYRGIVGESKMYCLLTFDKQNVLPCLLPLVGWGGGGGGRKPVVLTEDSSIYKLVIRPFAAAIRPKP